MRPHVTADRGIGGNMDPYAQRRMVDSYPPANMPHHHNLSAHLGASHGIPSHPRAHGPPHKIHLSPAKGPQNEKFNLAEATREIGARLERVDTMSWIGQTLLLKVQNVVGNQITLEVLSPRQSEATIRKSEVVKKLPAIETTADEISYGVEPIGQDQDNPKYYQEMPLKTEEYDFSLKIPQVIELIRKKQSVIFEGARFAGKRRAIVGSIVSRVSRYHQTFTPKILVLTFERESAEYFYEQVKEQIEHMTQVKMSICVGSTKVRDNIRELQAGCQIVFGTPARLVDLISRGVLKLGDVKFLVMYCNRHLPAEFQEPLQGIARHLSPNFQYLITYPLGANFDFQLLQTYTFSRFGKYISIIDTTPHFLRLNINTDPLYKRDIMWMIHNNQRVGIICDRADLTMLDIWLGDFLCPIKCLIPTYKKLPSKGRERRHYIKQSKTLFKERVASYQWGILVMLQESVKFAPNVLDGSLDAIIIIGTCSKMHDPEYRDHMLVKPGGHIFVNIPDLQFNCPDPDLELTGVDEYVHSTPVSRTAQVVSRSLEMKI